MLVPGYDHDQLIARNAHARVYRARQRSVDREVAIKVLELVPADDEGRQRVIDRCAAIGRLTGHPGIITVLDSGFTDDGHPYLISPFCPKGSMADRVRDTGALAVDEVLRIGMAVAGGLSDAHRMGLVHGDIKPENVLVSAFGQPALADFAMTELVPQDEPAGLEITQALTVDHLAPELLDGGDATIAADVYALGSTLWTLVAGHPPFPAVPGEGLARRIQRIQDEPVPPLDLSIAPEGLEALLLEAMAKRPETRPTSADEVGRRLDELARANAESRSRDGSAVIDLRGASGAARDIQPVPIVRDDPAAAATVDPGPATEPMPAARVDIAPVPVVVAEDPELGAPTPPPPWRGRLTNWDELSALPIGHNGHDPEPTLATPRPATPEAPSAPSGPSGVEQPAAAPVAATSSTVRRRRWPSVVGAIAVMILAATVTLTVLSQLRRSDEETLRAIDATPSSTSSLPEPVTTAAVPPSAPGPAAAPPTTGAPGSPRSTTAPAVPQGTGQVVVPPATDGAIRRAADVAQGAATALADGNWAQARSLVPGLSASDTKLAADWGNLEHATVVVTDSKARRDTVELRIGVVAHERNTDGSPRTNLYCATWIIEDGKLTSMKDDQVVGGQPWRAGSWAPVADGIALLQSSCRPL